jgi:helix-turn-helix protein
LKLTPYRQLARKSSPEPDSGPPIARKPGEPFNPFGLFNGNFIPEAICRYRGLSLGAKMVYGRFCRYAGRDGTVYPSIPTLAAELGIGKTQARTYVQELEHVYFIAVDRENRHFFPNGSGGSNKYVFLWHVAFDGEEGKSRKTPPVRKTGGVPLRKTGPLPLRKTGGKENHHQESQKEESQSKGSRVSEPRASMVCEETEKHTLSVDDDEKHPEVPQYGSPWEELRAVFRAASGGAEMHFQDECWLKEQMELRRVTPEGLLQLVRKNPLSGFRSPMAGLKWLVKRFRTKTRSAPELEAAAQGAVGTLSPPAESPRCEKCGNSGRALERIESQRPRTTDQYCDCRMGKELEAIERRLRTAGGASLLDGPNGDRPLAPAAHAERNDSSTQKFLLTNESLS